MTEYVQFYRKRLYRKRKMGIQTTDGRTVVEPIYDFVASLSDGCFQVQLGKMAGHVDTKGALLFPLTDAFASLCDFHEGLAGFYRSGKYGFIDKSGTVVIPEQFAYVEGFHEGLSLIRDEAGRNGFIDKRGEIVIACQFAFATSFSGGYAKFGDEPTFGIIDKSGRVVAEPRYVALGAIVDDRVTVVIQEDGGVLREGLLTIGGETVWNDNLDALNKTRATAAALTAAFAELLSYYYTRGCPCRFPRFVAYVSWNAEDQFYDMEALFRAFEGSGRLKTLVGSPAKGWEQGFECEVCNATYAHNWLEMSAFFAVDQVKPLVIRSKAPLGAPAVGPIPFALGFAGLEGHFDPQRYAKDYVQTEVDAVVAYLRAEVGSS